MPRPRAPTATIACIVLVATAGCVAGPLGGSDRVSTVDCTHRLDSANATTGPALPDEQDVANGTERRSLVRAAERHVAWHAYSAGEGEDPDVDLRGITVENQSSGFVVHVATVAVGPAHVDDPAVTDEWSAHYHVDRRSIRRAVAPVNESADPERNGTVVCG
ncbi:hypothetical protein [Halorubellus salinus]|uniref:hypothetical protein n=1 Tax=Halorubellus salinus TaxID=755309 RepID=UPI001D08E530|nr:hypothetical protein [Halorubellus salinus]